jgi:hypothetical protein
MAVSDNATSTPHEVSYGDPELVEEAEWTEWPVYTIGPIHTHRLVKTKPSVWRRRRYETWRDEDGRLWGRWEWVSW